MEADILKFMHQYPEKIIQELATLMQQRSALCYIAGGTVRDWLMGIRSNDLDVTVARDAFGWAGDFARKLSGTLIPLDKEEDVARVVWQEFAIDFTSFREGAVTIEQDLLKRDFTINSMAVPFPDSSAISGGEPDENNGILDPAGGREDLGNKVIRATAPSVFISDPLRLLRAFRFMASFGFAIEPLTEGLIRKFSHLLHLMAEERISHELDLIMASANSYGVVSSMHENEILRELLPELYTGVGVVQPSSHHLDVFEHAMTTLEQMEAVQQNTAGYFPCSGDALAAYQGKARRKILLKWAALLHDLGKPGTMEVREDRGGRITFYNHDKEGARLFDIISSRLKWSRSDRNFVSQLISIHMWPFHLNNARKKTGLTPKAYMRLIKTAGEEFHGLFLLAMADSLAGRGVGKPPGMEEDIAGLYEEIAAVYFRTIQPVLAERLLTGKDLIEIFGLEPGPEFRKIFEGLENARVAGEVQGREQALEWVKNYLESHKII